MYQIKKQMCHNNTSNRAEIEKQFLKSVKDLYLIPIKMENNIAAAAIDIKKKRARSENWIEEDKILLLELIKYSVKIIENKNTDTNTNQKKKSAWVAVHERFNTLCRGGKRTMTQLKAQWGIAKINKKKELCAQRKETIKTGGGPSTAPSLLDNAQDITAWLPLEFTIDTNDYDSDKPMHVIQPLSPMPSPNVEAMETDNVKTQSQEPCDIQTNNTEKEKKNVPKKTAKKNLAERKIEEIAEAELEYKKELHALKVANQERKARNLDLKYEVLKAKLEFYKNKKVPEEY